MFPALKLQSFRWLNWITTNPFYYNSLYASHLEMMYFLIEPVIAGVPYLNPMIISDDELAELLIKLMR
ncbi:hypothetical protein CWM54_04855 [Klebsiella sp. D-Nf1]|nr:hypothetical protein CWM62_03475 [Klebsiella sp. C-Nf10]PJX55809.1 hypothetical protein CWM54_04855 [Klebsiella sp. D-Nf1]